MNADCINRDENDYCQFILAFSEIDGDWCGVVN